MSDWLINLVTLGLAQSWTLLITGDLVRTPQGFGLGELSMPGSRPVAEARSLEALRLTIADGTTSTLSVVRTPDGYTLMKSGANRPGAPE